MAHSIVNSFAEIKNKQVEIASHTSEQISEKLDMQFEAMLIPLGEEEPTISEQPKPIDFSTPLKIEEINEIYDREKTDYLKIAMKLNAVDLEAASEVADSENESLIQEIINPTPDLTIDDDIDIDTQFSDARPKISTVNFLPDPIQDIPNYPLYPHSRINTEDIYIYDSLRDLLSPGEAMYFPQPSTDDRKDFEIDIPENEMIVFKSPSLTFAHMDKKE